MPRTPNLATKLQHSAVGDASLISMLPEPALSVTIPSIQDDATLECRIYHPLSLSANPRAPPWRKHAAIVAHPYAPLGGCFDDAIVETVTAILLRQGFLVGTFNFRGAGKSTGRTSWTSKAERNDYMSFAGFLCHYVHHLDPFRLRDHNDPTSPSSGPISPAMKTPTIEVTREAVPPSGPILLMCGYSYGAMITTLLPPIDSILECFATPKTASAAADIRLRAQHLAEKENLILGSARSALAESPTSPRRAATGIRVGGDEDKRRSQDHVRRSFSLDAEDKIRRGVADLLQKTKTHHHQHRLGLKKLAHSKSDIPVVKEESEGEGDPEDKDPENLPPIQGLTPPTTAYLLISPPVGWATNLMTLTLSGSITPFFSKRSKSFKAKKRSEPVPPLEDEIEAATVDAGVESERRKMLENPTLAIYGDSDVFVAVKRFREWASKLQSVPGSKFIAHEISTAGHFYVEEGTLQRLADAVRAFSGNLLAQAE